MGDIVECIRMRRLPLGGTFELMDDAATEIERLRRRVADLEEQVLRALGDWQHINTAPKDREILVYCSVNFGKGYQYITTWAHGEWITWGDEPLPFEPTHWMSLPEPPIGG